MVGKGGLRSSRRNNNAVASDPAKVVPLRHARMGSRSNGMRGQIYVRPTGGRFSTAGAGARLRWLWFGYLGEGFAWT